MSLLIIFLFLPKFPRGRVHNFENILSYDFLKTPGVFRKGTSTSGPKTRTLPPVEI
jgi:hypothetical protein